MQDHARFIDELGGQRLVADWLKDKEIPGLGPISPQTISNWKVRGISWHMRPALAEMAEEKGVALPENFLLKSAS